MAPYLNDRDLLIHVLLQNSVTPEAALAITEAIFDAWTPLGNIMIYTEKKLEKYPPDTPQPAYNYRHCKEHIDIIERCAYLMVEGFGPMQARHDFRSWSMGLQMWQVLQGLHFSLMSIVNHWNYEKLLAHTEQALQFLGQIDQVIKLARMPPSTAA